MLMPWRGTLLEGTNIGLSSTMFVDTAMMPIMVTRHETVAWAGSRHDRDRRNKGIHTAIVDSFPYRRVKEKGFDQEQQHIYTSY